MTLALGMTLGELSGATQFESLNNMIVRAALKGPAFAKLNEDWQDEVVEERDWKIAIPPLWSSLINEYWERYRQLYAATPQPLKSSLIHPATGRPGGTKEAYADLTKPLVDPFKEKAAAAARAAEERARAAAREIGREAARGAQEESKGAVEAWWVLGLGGLAAVLWLNRSLLQR